MVELWEDLGPPVYLSVAGYLGLTKKRSSRKGKKSKGGNLDDLLKMFPGGVIN